MLNRKRNEVLHGLTKVTIACCDEMPLPVKGREGRCDLLNSAGSKLMFYAVSRN